jgi:hypothetical protein
LVLLEKADRGIEQQQRTNHPQVNLPM